MVADKSRAYFCSSCRDSTGHRSRGERHHPTSCEWDWSCWHSCRQNGFVTCVSPLQEKEPYPQRLPISRQCMSQVPKERPLSIGLSIQETTRERVRAWKGSWIQIIKTKVEESCFPEHVNVDESSDADSLPVLVVQGCKSRSSGPIVLNVLVNRHPLQMNSIREPLSPSSQ